MKVEAKTEAMIANSRFLSFSIFHFALSIEIVGGMGMGM